MATYAQLIARFEERARARTGLKQDQLAKKLGIARRSNLSNAKKDPNQIGIEKVLKLVDLGEATPDEKEDLLWEYLLWWLESKPQGVAVLDVVRDAVNHAPKDQRAAVRSKIIDALRKEIGA